ncbi:MerR family transcriptional regulator [Nakamurella lactea]|uniref:MerR family transcriptional regulator n=1 Tax=Nakamurella lactea TaxID=459515 RepID=UPI0004180AAC|nr:MerR family transcriptional regulator [Nakamurella lactea]
MRISELARTAGLSLPTVKYYLRLGLLPAGRAVSATESRYGDQHLRRLRLIRALRDVVGLPIDRVAAVLSAIDEPSDTAYDTLGRAVGALSTSSPGQPGDEGPAAGEFPLARTAIDALGWTYDPEYPAVGQLQAALAAAADVGVPMEPDRLATMGEHVLAMAEFDLSRMPPEPDAAIEYAVLGTALHEPVLLALRRLAHQHLAARS